MVLYCRTYIGREALYGHTYIGREALYGHTYIRHVVLCGQTLIWGCNLLPLNSLSFGELYLFYIVRKH